MQRLSDSSSPVCLVAFRKMPPRCARGADRGAISPVALQLQLRIYAGSIESRSLELPEKFVTSELRGLAARNWRLVTPQSGILERVKLLSTREEKKYRAESEHICSEPSEGEIANYLIKMYFYISPDVQTPTLTGRFTRVFFLLAFDSRRRARVIKAEIFKLNLRDLARGYFVDYFSRR